MKYKGRLIDLEPRDLCIDDLSNDNIRRVISRAPNSYAFYMCMAADIAETIHGLSSKRESRNSELYSLNDLPKKTESWKKNAVYNSDRDFFDSVSSKIAKLESIRTKLLTIARAFDMQVKALQTVGGLIRTEMEAIMNSETTPMEE